MTENLILLRHAADTAKPLHERWGVMDVLDRVKSELQGEDLEAYNRIKDDIMRRIQDLYNPAHTPG